MKTEKITYNGKELELPVLRHPNCENDGCSVCFDDHIALGRFVVENSDKIDASDRSICETEITFNWMVRKYGRDGAQTEHGWGTPETWEAKNILGMLEDPYGEDNPPSLSDFDPHRRLDARTVLGIVENDLSIFLSEGWDNPETVATELQRVVRDCIARMDAEPDTQPELSDPKNLKVGDWIRWSDDMGPVVAGKTLRVARVNELTNQLWHDGIDGPWYMTDLGQYTVVPEPKGGNA